MDEKRYTCVRCNFTSKNKKDYSKHLGTRKHKRLAGEIVESCEKRYKCEKCNKMYLHHSSYYRHKSKCKAEVSSAEVPVDNEKESLKKVIQKQVDIIERQTKEAEVMRGLMKELITATREMVPKIGNNNVSINVFLNEHCKNAMNLTDFVNKIRITLDDLMKTRQSGYVDGIANIFIRNLRDLSDVERPIHCSDKKRLKFYVKEDDKWDKDDGDKMKKAIDEVAIKQVRAIKGWEDTHPGYLEDDCLINQWRAMIQATMGGANDDDREKNEKEICKNVGENIILKDAMEKI